MYMASCRFRRMYLVVIVALSPSEKIAKRERSLRRKTQVLPRNKRVRVLFPSRGLQPNAGLRALALGNLVATDILV